MQVIQREAKSRRKMTAVEIQTWLKKVMKSQRDTEIPPLSRPAASLALGGKMLDLTLGLL